MEGDKSKYTLLSDAVKAAGDASRKKSKKGSRVPVTVSLDAAEYKVSAKLTVPTGVHIVGTDNGDGNVTSLDLASGLTGTVIAVTSNGDTVLQNIRVKVPAARKGDTTKVVVVGQGKSVELDNVEISAEESEFSKVGVSVGGMATIKNCTFAGVSVAFEKGSRGSIAGTTISLPSMVEEESCGVSFFGEHLAVSNCEVTNFAVGLLLHGDKETVENTKVTARTTGMDVDIGEVTLEKGCSLSASEGRAVKARAKTNTDITNASIANSSVGVSVEEGAHMKINSSKFKNIAVVAMYVEDRASLDVVESQVVGNGTSVEEGGVKFDAVIVKKAGAISMKKTEISQVSGRAVIVDGEGSKVWFEELTLSECGDRCILVTGGGRVTGKSGKIQTSQGIGLHLNDQGSYAELQEIELTGGNTGVLLKQGAAGDFEKLFIRDTKKKGIDVSDATASFTKCNVFSPGTLAVSIRKGATVNLNSCNLRKADEAGLRIIGAASTVNIVNCGFLQNEVGIHADAAKTNVDGCTFVESQRKTIEIQNMRLMKSTREGNLNKEAAIKLRWCNYIEPRLQGEDICNDMELLNAVTLESAFYGAFDYEYRMYCQTLMERMRQARKFDESDEPGNDVLAVTIMNSVRHIYKLIPEVKKLLLVMLADIPRLGMFCFMFKMGEDREGLYTIEELVGSWNNLPRTITYDEALASLDMAFKKKVVTEDVFDEQRDKVEEWQRANFVGSKYNRRRDYLLATAQTDPLRCWFFLNKEQDGRLRTEVLKFLVAPTKMEESVDNQKEHHFHGSWVGQWAVSKLGNRFLSREGMPNRDKNKKLFKAWCNALLDKRRPRDVTRAYSNVNNKDEEDRLLLWEAYKMIDDRETDSNIQMLFPGKGFTDICGHAANLFSGEGVLPGFFRRQIKGESDPEKVLDFLSNLPFKEGRKQVVIATLAHHYLPDDMREPKINDQGNKSENYDSCPICFVQKLFPWNELKLKNCKHDHRFCLDCVKDSMSMGTNLWGVCPGELEGGQSCNAEATRRDMELCGIEKQKIFNILEKAVTTRLTSIEGWQSCDVPGCIGGRSNIKNKKFYRCRLCSNMVTLDGGESDPTIEIKLLQGLDVSEAKRGNGVYRECYHCASSYEKGNACSTLSCPVCKKVFSMSYGSDKITHRFDETGIQAQHYVPKKEGTLWRLGVFKDKKGRPLKLGELLNDAQVQEVLRRAKLKLREYLD